MHVAQRGSLSLDDDALYRILPAGRLACCSTPQAPDTLEYGSISVRLLKIARPVPHPRAHSEMQNNAMVILARPEFRISRR
jgi:hypothetical protein